MDDGVKSSNVAKKMSLNFEFLKHLRFEHLVAGTAGGVSATLVLHPLDLIKIRFQGECRVYVGKESPKGNLGLYRDLSVKK